MPSIGKTAVFRQGTWQKEKCSGVVPSAARGYDATTATSSNAPHSLLASSQPPPKSGAAATSRTAGDIRLSAAAPPLSAVSETMPSYYPTVAYHGLLREVELCVDVHYECSAAGSAGGAFAPRDSLHVHAKAPVQGSPQLVRRMGEIQRALSRVLEEHGRLYYVGTQPLLSDDELRVAQGGRSELGVRRRHRGPDDASLADSSGLPRSAYVDALTETFCRMSRLRDAAVAQLAADAVCHHATYICLRQHPLWKDVNVCLSVEGGRLVLFVSAASRVTQHYLTTRAAELGVELTWIAGATLVSEPTQLRSTDLNPVHALWETFANLPSHAAPTQPPPQPASSPRPVRDPTDSFAVPRSMATEEGCEGTVMILSSLPLSSTHCYATRLRLSDEVPLFEQPSMHDVAASDTTAAVIGAARDRSAAERRMRVGRRYRWRLVGPLCVMHGYLLSHLLRCLIEECALRTFELHFADVTPWWRHITSTAELVPAAASRVWHGTAQLQEDHTGGASTPLSAPCTALPRHPTRGLTYVHGVSEQVSITRGPSSLSWLGFSRLSCGAWADDATRRRLGLIEEDDEDGDETELEYEFTPRCLRYAVPLHDTDALQARPTSGCRLSSDRLRCCSFTDASFVRPRAWGPYFTTQLHVVQIISLGDDSEP